MVFIVQAKPWKPDGIEKVIAATRKEALQAATEFREETFPLSQSSLTDAFTPLRSSPKQWWMWKPHSVFDVSDTIARPLFLSKSRNASESLHAHHGVSRGAAAQSDRHECNRRDKDT